MLARETTDPIPRLAFEAASSRLRSFPILTITGPRQSGKTTLSRLLAPHLPYLTLEDPDTRAYASEDPRGFLRQVPEGAILDEVQRCPSLFSYLQGVVDAERVKVREVVAEMEGVKVPPLPPLVAPQRGRGRGSLRRWQTRCP